MIHPTAQIHPDALLHPSVVVGPFCVIDAGVSAGEGSVLGAHVHLTGNTSIGKGNRFFTGSVIGEEPQDLRYRGELTRLKIGDRNVFREHVTIHRSNKPEEDTVIGSDNFFMASCHVGHNARVGNRNLVANGALIAGHVTIGDSVFISGNCLIHQFARVGTLALMQGGSAISKDLPPYTIARGDNTICGLNIVGMRRAGLSNERRLELKQLYRLLFRSGASVKSCALKARHLFTSPESLNLLDFIDASKRGVCVDSRYLDRTPEASENETV